MKKILILLGSNSDLPQTEEGLKLLKDLKINYELKVISAHRDPDKLRKYLKNIDRKGVKVIIACAGLSAALPGVVSSYVDIPVIGVPLYSKAFKGVDSLLSILQMPKGVPVACTTVGGSGIVNAVVLALRILALFGRREKDLLKKVKKKFKKK
ncbi:MAG TPA: 5-(carboxyamino)imidazole ribonucleotide mutase [Candidatus Omnitrophica bacterium]|nr:MAG: 5-(carboxyamino)imidazole ribonucleotide mutase [Candidatus Omnitrophota bacterium]RKY35278.1 MAG: 5-(carboxyamino)imidazole ribonucleotide mutase [Candidatus Omnitrophota bacterium]HEC69056.1 5-(carboxyamino)imidazole ribonucleotide mutase [Candidatus Omnitrophota bacterium]